MRREADQTTISPADLFKAAETAAHSGLRQTVTIHGKTLAIVPQESIRRSPRRGYRRVNGFLAAYGSVSPLSPPRTDNEMTEIAAEEAARVALL